MPSGHHLPEADELRQRHRLLPRRLVLRQVNTGYKSNTGRRCCDAAPGSRSAHRHQHPADVAVNYTGATRWTPLDRRHRWSTSAGIDRWSNNECGTNRVCEPNGVLVDGLAALDANTGARAGVVAPAEPRGVGIPALTTFPAGTFPGSDGGLPARAPACTASAGRRTTNWPCSRTTTTTTPTPGGPIPSGSLGHGRLGGLDESNGSSAGVAASAWTTRITAASSGVRRRADHLRERQRAELDRRPDGTIRSTACASTAGRGTARGTPSSWTPATASQPEWQQGTGDTLINQGVAGSA